MHSFEETDLYRLGGKIRSLCGDANLSPDASIVIPVNAQGDLVNVLSVLNDIADYSGNYSVEIILVVNNYEERNPPPEIEIYKQLSLKVISIPDVRKPGEAAGFSARIPGARASASENLILFDADVYIPNSTALIDWYIDQLRKGVCLAYTKVGYYQLSYHSSVRFRILLHHFLRYVKRGIFSIPTARGSNYALKKSIFLKLYDQKLLADEMNVGPTFKKAGYRIVYSGKSELSVMTSGRMFTGGWLKIIPYNIYRLTYNLRVLRVRKNAHLYTHRENDPIRRYDKDNRPQR